MSVVQFDSSFKVGKQFLTEKSADRLFEIYRTHLSEKAPSFMKEDCASIKKCTFPWKELDIGLPIDAIERIAREQKVIQLRPVDPNAKILVVGCGNKPLVDAGGFSFLDKKEKTEYQARHAHPNTITINPHLPTNPTIIGLFGSDVFPVLPDGQFDLIVMEGAAIEDTPGGRRELERLASKTGRIVATMGRPLAYPFSWELNNASNADIQSGRFQMPKPCIDLSSHPSFQPVISNKYCVFL